MAARKSRKVDFNQAMYENNIEQLKKLFHELEQELLAFETGPSGGVETGFFHLPSGRPMKMSVVKKRFLKIAKVACQAAAKASEASSRLEQVPKT